MLSLSYDKPASNDRGAQLERLLGESLFNLPAWIARAGFAKASYELVLPQAQLTADVAVTTVRDYFRDLRRARELDGLISAVFVDPTVRDAQADSAPLRLERDTLRRSLEDRQPLVEAILQDQIEAVLREEGFGVGGQIMPPMRFNMTRLPFIMIVSRRDRIERIDQRELRTGLTVDVFDVLEQRVDDALDVSSLVTPIGGYGTYPTMLPETSSLRFVIDTGVHEWTHNYLLPSYVGLSYNDDAVARTINETAAVIVQQEIGKRVLARYYPDVESEIGGAKPLLRGVVQAFDYRAEMRETRVTADDLLGAGKIDEAERYMEERRQLFVASGYQIRKLNQAYFAFYGAYNAERGGSPAAGKDPVGPAVQALRARSPSLYAFVRAIADVRTLRDVESR